MTCVLLVLLVMSLYMPSKHESFKIDPYPINASHEWADTDYDTVVATDETARIQWHHVDDRGMFNVLTNDDSNTYSNDGIYAKPMGSFIAQPPSRPDPLPLRQCRSLNWNCQRPWMNCSGPVYQPYWIQHSRKYSSRKAKENTHDVDL